MKSSPIGQFLSSSIGKKYLMALSGFVFVGFVLGHMAGNLLVFAEPHAINAYAKKLKDLPFNLLWVLRGILLASIAIHIWTAVTLSLQNRAARPKGYCTEKVVQASYASRTMPMSGLIILCFIIFHILHYTTRNIFDYSDLVYSVGDKEYFNVYNMIILGFSKWYVSLFYIVSMLLLCLHLFHGVSSMFQTLGIKNEKWRNLLNRFAQFYSLVIFIGFISVPFAVMFGFLEYWIPDTLDAISEAKKVVPL